MYSIWLNVERCIIHMRAWADKLPTASLLIDLSFQIGNQKKPEALQSWWIRSRLHPFYWRHSMIRGLLSPSLRGEVVCQRLIPSGALLDLGVSSTVHGGTFPRITLIHDEWKHPEEEKKELLLTSIQQPRPLISAGVAHNKKGRLPLSSSTSLCNKSWMTIDNFSWYNIGCFVCERCQEPLKHMPQMF